MRKSYYFIISTLILSAILPNTGIAQMNQSQINQELNKINKSITEEKAKSSTITKEINQIEQQKKQIKSEITAIQGQMDAAGEKLFDLQQKLKIKDSELQDNVNRLNEAIERVDERKKSMETRLKVMYMNGMISYFDVLFSSTSFGDFIERFEALKSILEQDKRLLDSLEKDREMIAQTNLAIKQQQESLKLLLQEAERVKSELALKEKNKEVAILSLNQKEEYLEEVSEEQEKKLMALASKQAALLKARSNTSVKSSNSKLQWPLPKKYPITSNFGTRIDPITGKSGASHNGLDIGAPSGTSILAAEAGTVIVAQWWSTYGNTVVIDHGNGLWTLYPHMRMNGIKVKKGDLVKRGQLIGEVGSTGRSTGPHLHFEVRVNEKAINPESFLN
ncbi:MULTISPECIES: murein hydrolase activator EnvC family protein [Paenibacillus]|nr:MULTISPECIES: peptidoglycan DD-metalloendopeptidase family protein [Paenibacillus]